MAEDQSSRLLSASPAFRHFIATHSDPKWRLRWRDDLDEPDVAHILHATWFLGEYVASAIQLTVSPGGRAQSIGEMWNYARRGYKTWQLSEDDLAALPSELTALEPLTQEPTLDDLSDLIILSFRRHGQWSTGLYDAAKLPTAVAKLAQRRSGRYVWAEDPPF